MLGVHHAAICTANAELSMGIRLRRKVGETLSALAELGFADGVRRITVAAPAGKTMPMAVIAAPHGVVVELIGPPR
jgi:glyoxylase I family protein